MYAGRILKIDLSENYVKELRPDDKIYREFIGGSGIAVKLHLDMESHSKDPYGPENPVVIMTGPLTGSAPSCSKIQFTAKSPLTLGWGESNAGGKLAIYLKRAGWDGMIIVGKSRRPAYIHIDSNGAEIKKADHLWGKTTYETIEELKKEEGNASVAAIGPAGENLVRYACIILDNSRAAGRTGMGAVFGSKMLKAIAVSRDFTFSPEMADPEKFMKAVRELAGRVKDSFTANMFKEVGTGGYVESAEMFGDLPVKYFTEGEFGKADRISSNYLIERYFRRHDGCMGCSIKCGKVLEYGGKEYHLPEYETLASFGSLLLIDSGESLIEINHLANSLGLDTISCGVTIGMAMYLTEKNLADFGIKFGDAEKVKEYLKLIACRQNHGDMLAEGTMRIEEKLGLNGIAAHVRGLEIPMHDPRAFFSLAVAYATNNRGACHLPHQMYNVEMGLRIREYGIESSGRLENDGKGEITAKMQNFAEIFNCLVMCVFVPAKPSHISSLLKFSTGFDYSPEKIYSTGEKIFNLKRKYNELSGRGKEHDRLPDIVLHPVSGGTEGKVPDVRKQLQEYYDFRGWTSEF